MAKLMLTWHTAGDDRVCPICQAINGYTWTFDTSSGEHLDGDLLHPQFGIVWNIQSGSQAHGHSRFNCRCHMTSAFDLSDLVSKAEDLLRVVEASAQ